MIVVAHIGGLPVEESIAQLAPTGIVVLVAAHAARDRIRRCVARLRGARTRMALGWNPLVHTRRRWRQTNKP